MITSNAHAGISLVQKGSLGNGGSALVTSETSVFTNPVTAGDLIVVAVRYGYPTSLSKITVTDNVNGAYTLAYDGNDPSNGRQIALFYFANSAASAAGLTATCSVTAANMLSCGALEYSGAATVNPLDGTPAVNVFTASTSMPSSGTVTPTQPGDLAIGSLYLTSESTATISSESEGFTAEFDITGGGTGAHGHTAQDILSGASPIAYSPTLSSAQTGIVAVALFKAASSPPSGTIQNVFVIMMEDQNLSSLNSLNAPYTMGTLAASGAMATQYYNPPNSHPSEPNYVWLEAGDNQGLTTDNDPSGSNSSASLQHLATYLANSGISWRAYVENISGIGCPLASGTNSLDAASTPANYYANHVPFLFFQDLTDGESASSSTCASNVRPYSDLAADLANGTTARYNFIVPNGTDDMKDSGIASGDSWLANNVPAILNSRAYQNNGLVLILWDEAPAGDGPIPLIALSPLAKPKYTNAIHYDHSSTVLTLQEIFGVGPCLRNACSATDLADLFQPGTIPALPVITIAVNPISATLSQGQTKQFGAAITGTQNTAVAWTLTPSGLGTINSAGLYTAPAQVSAPATVQVTATSQADPTKSATATITLLASDFNMTASPATQTVIQGGGTSYTVSFGAINNFNGSISLSARTLPSGVGVSFLTNPVANPSQTSTMNVTTTSATPPGTYTIAITGTSGNITHQASVSLVVNSAAPPGGYSLSGTISPSATGSGTTLTLGGSVPVLVQSAPGSSSTGHSSGTVSFAAPSVAGDTIVLFLRFGGTTVTSVTDNQAGGSNAYTSILGPTHWGVTSGTDRWAQVFLAKNITGGTKLTITVTLAGASTHDLYMAALEYSGVDPLNPVNATAVGTGTVGSNGAPKTGNFTTTLDNTKLVATSWDSNESYTVNGNGTGYTTDSAAGIKSISGGSGWANLTEDRTASAGTWNATASSSPAVVDWAIQVVALAPASSQTAAPVTADASGNYTFTGLASGTYTIIPSKTGVTFTPPSQVITVSSANVTGVNFTAQSITLAPLVSLSTATLTFGNQAVNTTSASQSVTLTNTGNAALNISSIGASGDYSETNTCGSSVAAGANCSITVKFTPTTSGTRTGAITITDNAANSPQMIALTGTGTTASPVASLSPTSLTFASQTVGTTSSSQRVRLRNTGTATLTISSIVVSGDFSLTTTCGASLSAGSSCSINVRFKPTATGTRTGAITVTDNAAGSPQIATLTGVGK